MPGPATARIIGAPMSTSSAKSPWPRLAVVAVWAIAFALVEFNEGAYWAATMRVARADTGAATGVLNTGGNFGGILVGPVLGYLSGIGAWNGAFALGAIFCLVAAALWLLVDTDRRVIAAT